VTVLVDREAKKEVGSLSDDRREFERQHRGILGRGSKRAAPGGRLRPTAMTITKRRSTALTKEA
jgi:hypothetical protein